MAFLETGLSLGLVILAQAPIVGSKYQVRICAEEGDCDCARSGSDGSFERGRNVVRAEQLRRTRDGECSDLVGDKELTGAHLDEADLQAAGLAGARLKGAHLNKTNLGWAHLEEAHLEGARAFEADFSDAHLSWSIFDEDSQLEGANFLFADLQNAILNGADLRGACLRHAHLHGAFLVGADLRGANLEAYTLRFANLTDAIFDHNTRFPQEITLEIAVKKLHMIQAPEDAPLIADRPCQP